MNLINSILKKLNIGKSEPLISQPITPSITAEAAKPAEVKETKPKRPLPTASCPPPLISYIAFNRLGLTARNLTAILSSNEDFEMNIIDCNSKDDSWSYIQQLNDSRIKSKIKLPMNMGPIYAVNFNLTFRRPNQYFFAIDSDVYIKTPNWISKYMEVFDAFPEVGVLGVMRDDPYPRYMPPIIPRVNGNASYLQLKNAGVDVPMDFIPGHLQCLRPELIEQIGFWSEENGYGDAELSPRVVHYTPFTVGFMTNIEIDMKQQISCAECKAQHLCRLDKVTTTCFLLSRSYNKNESFAGKFKWKYIETFKEHAEGKRTAYCGSLHKPESVQTHFYHYDWATENFDFYTKNSN